MKLQNEKKLLAAIKFTPIIVVLFLSTIATLYSIHENRSNFEEKLKQLRSNLITNAKNATQERVQHIYKRIKLEKSFTETKLKQSIKERVYEAYAILTKIYEENKDKNKQELKKLLKDSLRDIRFNNGRGYYFIYKMDGTVVLLPPMKKFEGKSMWDFKDAEGVYAIREMSNIIKKNKEGFYSWYWYKPGNNKVQYKKIGFGKYFKPFNWFIGTGEYIDDFDKNIQQNILNTVKNLHGKDAYVFIFDYSGNTIAHYDKKLEGTNQINLHDPNGFMIVQNIIKTAKQGSGFISYINTIQSNKVEKGQKVSFIEGFDPWKWAIGSGFYIQDLEKIIKEKELELTKTNNKEIQRIILFSVILTIVFAFLSLLATKTLQKFFISYKKEVEKNHTQLNLEKNKFQNMFQTHDSIMLLVEPKTGEILDANLSAQNFYGYSYEELKHLSINQINMLNMEEIKEQREKAQKNNQNYFIFPHKLKNGEIKIVEVHSSPIKVEGKVLLFSIIRDITKEKKLEQQIKIEKDFISAIIENSNAIIAVIDINGVMQRLNKYGQEFVGYTIEQIQSEPFFWAKFLKEEIREKVFEIIEKAKQGEIITSFKNSWISKNGEERIFEWSNTIIQKEDGSMNFIATIGIDVTDKDKFEQQIANEKKKYQRLMDQSADAIHILDQDGNILECSYSFAKMLGYDYEEALQLNLKEWDYKIPQDQLYSVIQDIIQNEQIFETQHKRKDGTIIDVQINAKGITLNGKKYLYASARDITEEKKLKNQLEVTLQNIQDISSEQQVLLSLFDKGDSVLFKWKNNPTWNVEHVSHSVEKIFGYTKEEFLSQEITYASCIVPEDIENVSKEVEDALQNNSDFFKHQPYRIITKNNEIKWILDFTVTQKDESGNITHFIGYILDITDSVHKEIQLKEAKESADKANKAKSEFLANMSHEIRTPLNGIIGLTDLVLQTELSSIQKNYLVKSKKSSNALLHIINDILDYSKIEAGKLDIVKQEFNFDILFENIKDLFGYKAFEKNIDLIFFIDPTIPQTLIGDSLRLIQILNNLVGNALKFTEEGNITISLHKNSIDKGNKIVSFRLCVEDTGVGISKENQQKLFQSFEQLDSSNTKKYGGSGLGLMISKQLVELMDGTIFVESEEGIGSKFCFDLNLEYKEEENSPDKLQYLHQGKTFLIVDDNEIDRDYLVTIFNSWDIKTLTASSGIEAIDIIKENTVDYLIVDWIMPSMDGIEFLKEIKNKNLSIKHIFMVTAHDIKTLLDKASNENLNIEKILHKPYTPSALYNLLLEDSSTFNKTNQLKEKLVLSETKKALLVEDNKVNQLVAKKTLEKIGFSIDIANDGVEAVAMSKETLYDIIFMDLQMPNMDGFEASEKIREFDSKTPIIALSAAVMQEDKELTFQAGMNFHLAKPIEKQELYKVLKNYFQCTQVVEQKENKPLNEFEEIDIKGIDIKKLVQDMTNTDPQTIYSFYDNYINRFKDLSQTLDTLEYNSKEFKEYIHGLKGVSGNLHIDTIFTICKEIESIEEPTQKVDQLKKEFSFILKEIQNKISPKITLPQELFNNSEAQEAVDTMISLFENSSFVSRNSFNKFISNINDFLSSEEKQMLHTLFDKKDFEKLSQILQDIKQQLIIAPKEQKNATK